MSDAKQLFQEGISQQQLGDNEAALIAYQKATQIDPDYFDAFYEWALLLLDLGRSEEARSPLEQCRKLQPESSTVYAYIGSSYEEEDPAQAIRYYQIATEKNPKYVEAFNAWGNVLLAQHKKSEAQAIYEKCIAIDPNYHFAYFNLGLCYQGIDDNKAIENYKLVIEKEPSYFAAYLQLANIYFNQVKYPEAREHYEKCIQLDPNYSYAYYYIGQTYEDSDPALAMDYYQKTINVAPNHVNAYNRWGNLLFDQKNYEEAIPKYEACIAIDPDFKYAYFNLGQCYEDSDPEKALQYFKSAIEKDPSYTSAYNALGNFLLEQGDLENARIYLQKCIDIDPSFKLAYYHIAKSYDAQFPLKALDYFSRAVAIDPEYLNAINAWGNTLLKLERYEEAREKYRKCLTIQPDYKYAYYNLGTSYHTFDPEKAMEYYQHALEIDQEYLPAHDGIGSIYLQQGRMNDARVIYEQSLKLDPKFKTAYYNLGFSYFYEEPGKAIAYYKSVIELDPEEETAYRNIQQCIGLLDDKDVYLQDFIAYIHEKDHAYGYWALGDLYLYTLHDYQSCQRYYQKCKEAGIGNKIYLDYSNLFDSVGDLKKSIQVLDEVIDMPSSGTLEFDSSKIYAKHNKAHYLLKMGHYSKARQEWEEVLEGYQAAMEQGSSFRKDANNYMYQGSIHYEIFGNIDRAEELFKEGIRRDPKNLAIKVSLNRLFAEKDKRTILNDRSYFWERVANIKDAEALFNKPLHSEDEAYQMAELYFTEELYDKSQALVKTQAQKGIQSSRWYNLQGQLALANEHYDAAIQAFKNAIKLESHNLTLEINLANVYLRNKNQAEAELRFKKVLQKDPNNVDALIGLGEIHLNNWADQADDLLLDSAEKYFLKALNLGRSMKGSLRLNLYEPGSSAQKRKYKDLKLSDLYYSLGYIKFKRYEADQFSRGNSLLNDCLSYFRKAEQSNPDHLKAIAARNKIDTYLKKNQRNNRMENFGAWLITSLSMVLFLLCQYFFYFNPQSGQKYTLDRESITFIESLLPEEVVPVAPFEKLKGIVFQEEKALFDAIEESIQNNKLSADQLALIQQLDLSISGSTEQSFVLPAGYYVLISFGAILFMIAGLYLPKLLKLKVGMIEIEKNSLSEVYDFSLLGIQK